MFQQNVSEIASNLFLHMLWELSVIGRLLIIINRFKPGRWFYQYIADKSAELFGNEFMTSKSFISSRDKTIDSQKPTKANRYNIVMSAMVELGLKIMKYKGTLDAAKFLAVAGVPVRVISRVLLRPDLRRNLKRRHFA